MIQAVNCFRPYECECHCECRPVEFVCEENKAQYKGSDYSNAIRVERGITLDQALKIAAENPAIKYFSYQKCGPLVLEIPRWTPFPACGDPLRLISCQPGIGYARVSNQGDAVFFGEDRCKPCGGKWFGDTYTADVYSKKQ